LGGFVEWAMLVPACIVLSLLSDAGVAFVAVTENALNATEKRCLGAFSTILLGSKYQWYAGTYRGRETCGGGVRFAVFCEKTLREKTRGLLDFFYGFVGFFKLSFFGLLIIQNNRG
jgi:hypothetical protein